MRMMTLGVAAGCVLVLIAGCGGGGGSGTSTGKDTSSPQDVRVTDLGKDTGTNDTNKPLDVPVVDQGPDDPGCTPDCKDKECGDNGCGGTCGSCGSNEECEEGKCECMAGSEACMDVCCDQDAVCYEVKCCAPDCGGKDCGDDGCGGTCGVCKDHHQCEEGTCIYQPWCGDGNCDTGTNEDCESCPNDCGCQGDDVCYLKSCCTPDCDGKNCGDDGCGDQCGTCVEHYQCEVGTCVYQPWCGDGTCDTDLNENCETCLPDCGCSLVCFQGECCIPSSCLSLKKECGYWDHGCGGTLYCGACQAHPNSFCNPSGQCDCTIDCNGKECGLDGCGGSCGFCGANEECSLQGQCQCVTGSASCGQTCCELDEVCFENQCCNPGCDSKECGDDGCGGICGQCTQFPNSYCDGMGHCACGSDTCTILGKECGGPYSDGCGGTVVCPVCSVCGETCLSGTCLFTACVGKYCGSDECGGICGICGDCFDCNNGQCDENCECMCEGKECGKASASNTVTGSPPGTGKYASKGIAPPSCS